AGVGIVADQGVLELRRREADAAAARAAMHLVVAAQAAAAVVDRHDGVLAVVAAVEEEHEQVAVAEVRERAPDERAREQPRAEQRPGGRESRAADELSSG